MKRDNTLEGGGMEDWERVRRELEGAGSGSGDGKVAA